MLRDRCGRLRIGCNGHAFPGFDRLMQPVPPGPLVEDAAGCRIDDADAIVAHDVIDVAPQNVACLQSLFDIARPGTQNLLERQRISRAPDPFLPGIGQRHPSRRRFDPEVDIRPEFLRDITRDNVRRVVDSRLTHAFRKQQRRAGIVDEDVVDFIDDREGQRTLQRHIVLVQAAQDSQKVLSDRHRLPVSLRELIAEIIEPEFVAGSIRNLAPVSILFFLRRLLTPEEFRPRSQKLERRGELPAVTFCEVLVRRSDVDASSSQ